MSKNELEEIIDGIESEGFDYYFNGYASPDERTDSALAELWLNYQTAYENLNNYIKNQAEILGVVDYE